MISVQQVEAVYELMRALPPFKGAVKTHADDMEFRLVNRNDVNEEFGYGRKKHGTRPMHLSVSMQNVTTTFSLLAAVAHGMIHVAQIEAGRKPVHDKWFYGMARQVRRHHGFDVA